MAKRKRKSISTGKVNYSRKSKGKLTNKITSGGITKGIKSDGKQFVFDPNKHRRDPLTGKFANQGKSNQTTNSSKSQSIKPKNNVKDLIPGVKAIRKVSAALENIVKVFSSSPGDGKSKDKILDRFNKDKLASLDSDKRKQYIEKEVHSLLEEILKLSLEKLSTEDRKGRLSIESKIDKMQESLFKIYGDESFWQTSEDFDYFKSVVENSDNNPKLAKLNKQVEEIEAKNFEEFFKQQKERQTQENLARREQYKKSTEPKYPELDNRFSTYQKTIKQGEKLFKNIIKENEELSKEIKLKTREKTKAQKKFDKTKEQFRALYGEYKVLDNDLGNLSPEDQKRRLSLFKKMNKASDKFLEAERELKTASRNLESVQITAMEKLTLLLLESSGVKKEDAEKIYNEKIKVDPESLESQVPISSEEKSRREKLLKENIIKALMLSGSTISTYQLNLTRDKENHSRASAGHDISGYTHDVTGRPIQDKLTINVGNSLETSSPETLMHEFGHLVEFQNRRLNENLNQWIRSRSDEDKTVKLTELTGNSTYREDEVAFKGDFISPYVAKDYSGTAFLGSVVGTPTEALSMGFQYFNSQKEMSELYSKDPEHFYLTIGNIIYNQENNK